MRTAWLLRAVQTVLPAAVAAEALPVHATVQPRHPQLVRSSGATACWVGLGEGRSEWAVNARLRLSAHAYCSQMQLTDATRKLHMNCCCHTRMDGHCT